MTENIKDKIRDFWTKYPCACNILPFEEGSREFFDCHDQAIDRLTPYHNDIYRYEQVRGKRVLEVGCGMGSHAWRFARYALEFQAIDLAPKSIELTKKRFVLHNLDSSGITLGDAEKLNFPDNYFDFVYSNGVIHHSPNTSKAVEEIYRVLKPGGKTIVMIYNKKSIFYLFTLMFMGQSKYALIKLMPQALFKRISHDVALKEFLDRTPWRNLSDIVLRFSDGHFNPYTKIYTTQQALRLFGTFRNVHIELRNSRDILFSNVDLLNRHFGWALFIHAEK